MSTIREVAEALTERLTPEQRESWDHSYSCKCNLCLIWWAECGPDGGEAGKYGPFTRDQVNAKQRELGIEVTP